MELYLLEKSSLLVEMCFAVRSTLHVSCEFSPILWLVTKIYYLCHPVI